MQTNLALTYRQRRLRLIERAGAGIFLIGSPGMSPDTVLWDKNLAYLTGLTDRSAYLLIVPQGVAVEFPETRSTPELMRGHTVREILFMQPRAEQDVFMEGEVPTFAEILAATGVDRVFPLDQMNATLQRALMNTDTLWLNTPPTPQLDKPLTAEMLLA